MKAVIMAGGEGSRLRPLTCDTPKPLVKLCGRPVSEYILDLLETHGCTSAVFTLHYLGEKIEKHFESGKYKNIELGFSYETEPLGTAGCVKSALNNFTFDDDILIISGDAICDFDLTAAFKFHKQMNADATIIAKHVDDPREYGLIIEKNGIISGFCEKPSFSGCVTDFANTGVYIISKKVLETIPENKKWDFAQDVFPQMLKEKMTLAAFDEKGYWCDIGDLKTYKKCQRDMLNRKVNCTFTSSSLENAKPPYYAGKNVTIGTNTVVSSESVIGNNVTIGKNCRVKGSVILDGAFIGDNVTLNYAVVCENAVIKSDSSVFENAVIGAESIIGNGCIIKSGSKIWNNKKIPSEKIVNGDIKYKLSMESKLTETGIVGETNADITPEFMVKLGYAVSAVFGSGVIIGASKNTASAILSAAFCTGFSASGENVINCGASTVPMLNYLSKILNASALIHIDASQTATITILTKGGMPLTRVHERRLESAISRGDYKNAAWNGFGAVKNFKDAKLLYSNMLFERYNFNSRYKIKIKCNNPQISASLKAIAQKISNESGDEITIILNRDGTKSELFVNNEEKADYTELVGIVTSELMKNGQDISIPVEFPSSFEYIARSLGRNVHRFFSCSNDNSDLEARKLAVYEDFLFDGAVLALETLNIISKSYISLGEYKEAMPKIICENRFLKISKPPQKILKELIHENRSTGEGVIIGEDGNRVLLRSNRRGDGLFLFAESVSAETAKSLCDDVEKRIKELLDL